MMQLGFNRREWTKCAVCGKVVPVDETEYNGQFVCAACAAERRMNEDRQTTDSEALSRPAENA